ncbi:hypothetical protein IWW36_003256 [Coemansia brasiliensis]|uniref:holo-[acyl-carrier-protein] synthase n=1 Tax=Coemansia brasiliensis TaxID=2650707 RepID=A0A9W8I5R8_9FUNG|nr:hypothetical protein IWW36_003256 [Coemansia brasiliensis]
MADFNISHDGNWVIAGYITNGIIGVDIAKVACPSNMTDMDYIKEFLSPEEMDYLMNSSTQKLLDFYRIWTSKEAYVKAIGTGIAEFDLCSISVHLLPSAANPEVYIKGKGSDFKFKSGVLNAESYVYCIATSPESECAFSTVDFLDFI